MCLRNRTGEEGDTHAKWDGGGVMWACEVGRGKRDVTVYVKWGGGVGMCACEMGRGKRDLYM